MVQWLFACGNTPVGQILQLASMMVYINHILKVFSELWYLDDFVINVTWMWMKSFLGLKQFMILVADFKFI